MKAFEVGPVVFEQHETVQMKTVQGSRQTQLHRTRRLTHQARRSSAVDGAVHPEHVVVHVDGRHVHLVLVLQLLKPCRCLLVCSDCLAHAALVQDLWQGSGSNNNSAAVRVAMLRVQQ
jgi:hypothetical protein